MNTAINDRYSALAESSCCLSCGKAIDFLEPQPGQTCVDIGSGRGTDVLRLAGLVGPTGRAIGVDVADGMIDKAQKTAEKLGAENVTFVRSVLEHIDLSDQTADWVMSNCTLNHASDKQAVWREIYRILKKGGRFVVSDIYAVEEIPAQYKDDPEAIAECWAGAVTRDTYLAQINDAGFSEVRIVEESNPYQKGKATVASLTLSGRKPLGSCCCSG